MTEARRTESDLAGESHVTPMSPTNSSWMYDLGTLKEKPMNIDDNACELLLSCPQPRY